MKSNRNFQKSKKSNSFDNEKEMRIKKVGAGKKKKNFKQEIFSEIEDDDEEFDLFGRNGDSLENKEDSNY